MTSWSGVAADFAAGRDRGMLIYRRNGVECDESGVRSHHRGNCQLRNQLCLINYNLPSLINQALQHLAANTNLLTEILHNDHDERFYDVRFFFCRLDSLLLAFSGWRLFSLACFISSFNSHTLFSNSVVR